MKSKENIKYEMQYIYLLQDIMENGYKQLNERTGVETLRIPHGMFQIDLQKEFPILHIKRVRWKTALKEILWIMQSQSNNINNLDAHIWDDWADPDGSIGKAYGYQVAKNVTTMDGRTHPSQVDYVLESLKEDPSNRRAVIDLWNVDDLGQMNLTPCCYSSCWNIIDGKLNCMLIQRSADYLVGVPFNTTQYAILTSLFAKHLGVRPGILTHVMSDVHIYCYESHINAANKILNYSYNELSEAMNSDSILVISNVDNNFFNVKVNDVQLSNYKYLADYKLEVAV